jgi:hypothetical protein
MAKTGMVQEFIKMVKLFNDAAKAVSLNRCITKSFKIESGLGKGARGNSLPSFFIVGEVLNFMFKEVVKFKDIKGITLFGK